MSLAYGGYGALVTLDPQHRCPQGSSLPSLPSYFYMLPSLGISIGGQFFVFFQMFFAYTSDYSASQGEGDRRFTRWPLVLWPRPRFIMAEGSVYFGAVAGSYASGLVFARFGYQVTFFAACCLNSLGLLYSLLYMTNLRAASGESVEDK